MNDSYDVVIIGGAVIGSAVAYFLTANPDFNGSVLVVERDPSYQKAATSLSSSSIRVQFSNPINVRISQYGSEFIRNFAQTMQVASEPEPDLNFHPGGYLFLANTEEQARTLRENHEVQRACGADVVLWNQEELARAFPHLNVDDILLASYGNSGEGWFNNTGLMYGFKAKAREQGAEYVTDEVVAIGRDGDSVTTVTLKSGAVIKAGNIVNAAGPRAALAARMAGLDVPVEPRKRSLFVFDCAQTPEGSATVNEGRLPLMIDPSGVFCRPEGRYFLSGCPPVEDPAVDWDDFEPRYDEFEEIIWPALAERATAFEAIKVVNQWAGHYDFNTLDHNLIVGPHPEVKNFIYANGYSGHGLQQGPAAGRAVSELIIYGGFRTLDLSEVGYERIVENRPFLEKAVI
ncbi:NAD(P)/FAD-dependent oxidoreductase [Paracoccus seriniphilus]|uniref:Glycine/D-amino acid oxidase n=2 Tax=Paracoccus seriniphilus TaxID=184748 RepID=A0A239PUE6_9RHOB|nr:FAD-binding oxidoreductase [Paracoccus seriniphilus]WCR15438.1 FAD-binding oxidoreductase [Paracoccus seriniphilus]SNT73929.1 Glycine/D-amino acid oxidase [Paracoccus seriniphilus]